MATYRFSIGLLALGAITSANAQDGEFKKATPKTLPPAEAPVTKAEAAAVFSRVEAAIRSALSLAKGQSTYAKGASPIAKAEVLAAFAKWRDIAEPKFKIRPRPVAYDAARLQSNDPQLKKLIAQGFVAKIGPLATVKGTTLKPSELGDAIGFFLARLSEHTQTPSTKFTPYLRTVDSDF